ncbi:MAG: Lrp/AsnC family transcriptional regulator [Proteobacteria bacterium]|nr:Lrp/AsnC family transcriptional regulator [Pseudomonadota bacterium]
MPTRPPVLDAYDRQLLVILQKDNRTPLRVLAEQVHLSTAAVQRRIRRMEDAGVITANAAVVDPDKVGQAITILVEVHAERTQTPDLDAMKAALSGPEVQQCYYVTGDADFVLVLTVSTMAEYEALARRLFYDNKNVQWFRTVVVMDRVKVGLNVPVPT